SGCRPKKSNGSIPLGLYCQVESRLTLEVLCADFGFPFKQQFDKNIVSMIKSCPHKRSQTIFIRLIDICGPIKQKRCCAEMIVSASYEQSCFAAVVGYVDGCVS